MKRKWALILCVIFFVLAFPFLGCSANRPLKYKITELNGENGVDFCIDFKKGREIRVLQLTDLQLLDLTQARNETRCAQLYLTFYMGGVMDREERVWKYVDEAVERCKPDLIVLTGDNIYGETDDDGSDWIELIEKIDSYKKPWLTIFGNHDNESAKGVTWQVNQLKQSEYCVFNRGNVAGNSNYNVLIKQGGVSKFLFYMLDTNGCMTYPNNLGEGIMPDNVDIDQITSAWGLQENQVQWYDESYTQVRKTYGEVPVLTFMHIAPDTVTSSIPEDIKMGEYYDDGTNFGVFKEEHNGVYYPYGFFAIAKENNCKGIFLGHNHEIATSTVYQGVRFTYGLKTGGDAYHDKDMLGSTKIVLKDNGAFDVEYLFSKLEYKL